MSRPIERPTDEQVERGLRLLYRLSLFARHRSPEERALAVEASRLLVSLAPGTIDILAGVDPEEGE